MGFSGVSTRSQYRLRADISGTFVAIYDRFVNQPGTTAFGEEPGVGRWSFAGADIDLTREGWLIRDLDRIIVFSGGREVLETPDPGWEVVKIRRRSEFAKRLTFAPFNLRMLDSSCYASHFAVSYLEGADRVEHSGSRGSRYHVVLSIPQIKNISQVASPAYVRSLWNAPCGVYVAKRSETTASTKDVLAGGLPFEGVTVSL